MSLSCVILCLAPQAVQVTDLNHPCVCIHTNILEQQWEMDKVGRVLRCVVAANGAIDEGMGIGAWVRYIEEVHNIEGRWSRTQTIQPCWEMHWCEVRMLCWVWVYACAYSRSARRTGCSSHRRWAWDEGDCD